MKFAILTLCLMLTACGGGGASVAETTSNQGQMISYVSPKINPRNILPSSYENKLVAAAELGPQNIPLDWKPCGDRFPCGAYVPPAFAFADFMRNGTYSLIVHSMEYNSVNPADYDRKGHIKLYESINGNWVDNTSKILKSNETQGCLHADKAIVADFMHNNMPSVFFSCFGNDVNWGIGERPHMLLGQNDGTYKNIEVPLPDLCRCTSASAADINGDGYPDIILTEDYRGPSGIFVLINNKDGTFTIDRTRFYANALHKALFAVELIDFNNDGKYDVILGGVEQCCGTLNGPVKIYFNDSTGFFKNNITIPSVPGFGMVLDIIYLDGNLYLGRTIDDPNDFYNGFVIQRVKYSTLESTILFESHSVLSEGKKYISAIIASGNNITGASSAYTLTIGK